MISPRNDDDFTPAPFENTAFGGFWRAVNQHLKSLGLPELLYGDAYEAWEVAVSKAGVLSRKSIIRAVVGASDVAS
jgi:hypothetical protein